MVAQKIVAQFEKVLEDIVAIHPEISLFAIFKMDELTDKWTVFLSAPWIDDSTRDETFYLVRGSLLKHLSSDEISSVSRIGIFEAGDHLMELLVDKYKTGDQITDDEKVNGNLIHEGYIFVSHKYEQTT